MSCMSCVCLVYVLDALRILCVCLQFLCRHSMKCISCVCLVYVLDVLRILCMSSVSL